VHTELREELDHYLRREAKALVPKPLAPLPARARSNRPPWRRPRRPAGRGRGLLRAPQPGMGCGTPRRRRPFPVLRRRVSALARPRPPRPRRPRCRGLAGGNPPPGATPSSRSTPAVARSRGRGPLAHRRRVSPLRRPPGRGPAAGGALVAGRRPRAAARGRRARSHPGKGDAAVFSAGLRRPRACATRAAQGTRPTSSARASMPEPRSTGPEKRPLRRLARRAGLARLAPGRGAGDGGLRAGQAGAVLAAMTLGDWSGVTPETSDAFRAQAPRTWWRSRACTWPFWL